MEEMKTAMKARDVDRLGVLRYMISEIKNKEIDAKRELIDEEVIDLLRTEVKRRQEAIAQYESGGRADLVTKERAELAVIEGFLPQLMSREAVEAVVSEIVASGLTDFGQVMRAAMEQLKGKADGKLVSQVVKQLLG
jgi:uncharacterized protein YqeY